MVEACLSSDTGVDPSSNDDAEEIEVSLPPGTGKLLEEVAKMKGITPEGYLFQLMSRFIDAAHELAIDVKQT